jgi:hypothetical protein
MSTPTTVRVDGPFSEALRAELVSYVRQSGARRRRRALLVAGAFAGIGLAGGGIAVAADVWILPGADVVTPEAAPVIETHTGTATVDLGAPPAGATHIELQLWCLTPGTFTFPDGATTICSAGDVGTAGAWSGYSIPVQAGVDSVTITAVDDARWRLEATYAERTTTPLGVNANGDTYGVDSPNGHPDLIAVTATNGRDGYAYATDLDGPMPANPEEAATWNETHGDPRPVPVYESDGETVIGEFVVGG